MSPRPTFDLSVLTRAADETIRLRAMLSRLRPEDGPAVGQAATLCAVLHGTLLKLPITNDVESLLTRVVDLRRHLMALATVEFPETSVELRSLRATARELYALLGDLEVQAAPRFRARRVTEMAEAEPRQSRRHGSTGQ